MARVQPRLRNASRDESAWSSRVSGMARQAGSAWGGVAPRDGDSRSQQTRLRFSSLMFVDKQGLKGSHAEHLHGGRQQFRRCLSNRALKKALPRQNCNAMQCREEPAGPPRWLTRTGHCAHSTTSAPAPTGRPGGNQSSLVCL